MLVWWGIVGLVGIGRAEIHAYTLSNGIQAYVDDRHHIEQISMEVHIDFQPVHSKPGLAHMVEHLLFESAPHTENGQYEQTIQKANGQSNAKTHWDSIVLESTFDSGALESVLFLEADRLTGLCTAVTEENLENQRQIIAHEMLMESVRPMGGIPDKLRIATFSEHPTFSTEIMGLIYDIENIHSQDVCKFVDTWFRAEQISLFLVGDVDVQTIEQRLEYWFADIPESTTPPLVIPTLTMTPQHFFLEKPHANSWLFLVFPIGARGSKEESVYDYLLQTMTEPSLYQNYPNLSYIGGWSQTDSFGGWMVFQIRTENIDKALQEFDALLQDTRLIAPAYILANQQRNLALITKMQMSNASTLQLLRICAQSIDDPTDCYRWHREHRGGFAVEDVNAILPLLSTKYATWLWVSSTVPTSTTNTLHQWTELP